MGGKEILIWEYHNHVFTFFSMSCPTAENSVCSYLFNCHEANHLKKINGERREVHFVNQVSEKKHAERHYDDSVRKGQSEERGRASEEGKEGVPLTFFLRSKLEFPSTSFSVSASLLFHT